MEMAGGLKIQGQKPTIRAQSHKNGKKYDTIL